MVQGVNSSGRLHASNLLFLYALLDFTCKLVSDQSSILLLEERLCCTEPTIHCYMLSQKSVASSLEFDYVYIHSLHTIAKQRSGLKINDRQLTVNPIVGKLSY